MFSSAVKIRPRRGSASEWTSINPILLEGELGIEYSDNGLSSGEIKIKVGDGISHWEDLPYGLSASDCTSIDAGGPTDTDKVIAIKRATTEEWLEYDPVLENAEIAYDETTKEIKVGDGIHKFSELRYIGQTWNKDIVYDFGNYDNPDS